MRNKVYSVIYPIIWIFMRIIHPWKAVGADKIPEGAAVICGNHTTLGDPLYVVCAMGGKRQTHVMAKAEVRISRDSLDVCFGDQLAGSARELMHRDWHTFSS